MSDPDLPGFSRESVCPVIRGPTGPTVPTLYTPGTENLSNNIIIEGLQITNMDNMNNSITPKRNRTPFHYVFFRSHSFCDPRLYNKTSKNITRNRFSFLSLSPSLSLIVFVIGVL